MKYYFYPNHVGYFKIRGLTLIMTVCANAGHQVKLFDTTFMNTSTNEDQKKGVWTSQASYS